MSECFDAYDFYAPPKVEDILFLSCHFVVNFNFGYNFWTTWNRDFIFDMHTLLMKLFQVIPRLMNEIGLWHLYYK